jgi:hypothetical protein
VEEKKGYVRLVGGKAGRFNAAKYFCRHQYCHLQSMRSPICLSHFQHACRLRGTFLCPWPILMYSSHPCLHPPLSPSRALPSEKDPVREREVPACASRACTGTSPTCSSFFLCSSLALARVAVHLRFVVCILSMCVKNSQYPDTIGAA